MQNVHHVLLEILRQLLRPLESLLRFESEFVEIHKMIFKISTLNIRVPISFYIIKKYCQYSIYYDTLLEDISFFHQRHEGKPRIFFFFVLFG